MFWRNSLEHLYKLVFSGIIMSCTHTQQPLHSSCERHCVQSRSTTEWAVLPRAEMSRRGSYSAFTLLRKGGKWYKIFFLSDTGLELAAAQMLLSLPRESTKWLLLCSNGFISSQGKIDLTPGWMLHTWASGICLFSLGLKAGSDPESCISQHRIHSHAPLHCCFAAWWQFSLLMIYFFHEKHLLLVTPHF